MSATNQTAQITHFPCPPLHTIPYLPNEPAKTNVRRFLRLKTNQSRVQLYTPPRQTRPGPQTMNSSNRQRRVKMNDENDDAEGTRMRPSESNVTEDQEPFMGIKVRRKASFRREFKGDYIDVRSNLFLMKLLHKHGDKEVLFADKVLKFTSTGKMKWRILLITDCAVYIVDPEADALKRRIALAAVERMCLSELSDNFLVVGVPSEYDLLMASTRKTEIVTVLAEATKIPESEICFANSFEYNAGAEVVKEIQFEEVEGGVKTRIMRK